MPAGRIPGTARERGGRAAARGNRSRPCRPRHRPASLMGEIRCLVTETATYVKCRLFSVDNCPIFGDNKFMIHHVWRLSEGGDDNLGLAVTGDGLVLGRTPLIERRGGRFVVRGQSGGRRR